jgi:hypothetical protein
LLASPRKARKRASAPINACKGKLVAELKTPTLFFLGTSESRKNSGLRIADCGLRIADPRLSNSDCAFEFSLAHSSSFHLAFVILQIRNPQSAIRNPGAGLAVFNNECSPNRGQR